MKPNPTKESIREREKLRTIHEDQAFVYNDELYFLDAKATANEINKTCTGGCNVQPLVGTIDGAKIRVSSLECSVIPKMDEKFKDLSEPSLRHKKKEVTIPPMEDETVAGAVIEEFPNLEDPIPDEKEIMVEETIFEKPKKKKRPDPRPESVKKNPKKKPA